MSGLLTNNIVKSQGKQKGETPLTPEMVEISSEEESLFGDADLNREIADSAGLGGAIQMEEHEFMGGDHGIFDDHYNLRKVDSSIYKIHLLA